MPLLDLSSDELLSTTRTVRKRLDLTRPVEPELIRECVELATQSPTGGNASAPAPQDPQLARTAERIRDSSWYLAEHMGDVPVLVVPCIRGRLESAPSVVQASTWGSILPAVWSFMLAARSRGLGTAWTTLHLLHEKEAAELLGIPYEKFTQAALIPLAHTAGTDFKLGPRKSLDEVLHWDQWENTWRHAKIRVCLQFVNKNG